MCCAVAVVLDTIGDPHFQNDGCKQNNMSALRPAVADWAVEFLNNAQCRYIDIMVTY